MSTSGMQSSNSVIHCLLAPLCCIKSFGMPIEVGVWLWPQEIYLDWCACEYSAVTGGGMEIGRFCNSSLGRKILDGSLSTSLVQPFRFVTKNKNYLPCKRLCFVILQRSSLHCKLPLQLCLFVNWHESHTRLVGQFRRRPIQSSIQPLMWLQAIPCFQEHIVRANGDY
jgi:hypothetical protein